VFSFFVPAVSPDVASRSGVAVADVFPAAYAPPYALAHEAALGALATLVVPLDYLFQASQEEIPRQRDYSMRQEAGQKCAGTQGGQDQGGCNVHMCPQMTLVGCDVATALRQDIYPLY
jgi:hypothetical protein